MLWLEMSEDATHGGGSWGFTRSLWSPTTKKNAHGKWPFWENVLRVKAGDFVLHLCQDDEKSFVGFSVAATDGYKTHERPPAPGLWGYDNAFYRVPLRDFTPFVTHLPLHTVFAQHDAELRAYYAANREKPSGEKRSIFCVVQGGRLQCLNGAYLSEVDEELARLLLDLSPVAILEPRTPRILNGDIKTAVTHRTLLSRVGQSAFSEVVRTNYGHQCCFPGCTVTDDAFLVGAHIARWADDEQLRGHISNGLCLCLMHDKAFEIGEFSFSADLCVILNTQSHGHLSCWCSVNVAPFEGQRIRQAPILPSPDALAAHWERIGLAVVSTLSSV